MAEEAVHLDPGDAIRGSMISAFVSPGRLGLAACALIACSPQTIVVPRVEEGLEVDRLGAVLCSEEGEVLAMWDVIVEEARDAKVFVQSKDGPTEARIPVEPRDDRAARVFGGTISLLGAASSPLVQRFVSGFPSSGTEEVEVLFASACRDVDCGADETCLDGACVPPVRHLTDHPIPEELLACLSRCPADDPGQRPFGERPARIPGVLYAAEFDEGGEGVAYHDLSPGNAGDATSARPGTDVDLRSPEGYLFVESDPGEWLEFTVDVESPGRHQVEVAFGSDVDGSEISLELCGRPLASARLDRSSGERRPDLTTLPPVDLHAGRQILRVRTETAETDLYFFRFSLL